MLKPVAKLVIRPIARAGLMPVTRTIDGKWLTGGRPIQPVKPNSKAKATPQVKSEVATSGQDAPQASVAKDPIEPFAEIPTAPKARRIWAAAKATYKKM